MQPSNDSERKDEHNSEKNDQENLENKIESAYSSERIYQHDLQDKDLEMNDSNDNDERLIQGQKTEEIESLARRFNMNNLDRNFAPRPDEWREPMYSQTHESTSKMYTPGISAADQNLPRRRSTEQFPDREIREDGRRTGAFVRTLCLILVCALTSAAAAYGVMEYRFKRGDFTVVNQVILGGSSSARQNGGMSVPISTQGAMMPAEEIYLMACTQVVSISTKIEYSSSMFGGFVPSSANNESGSGFIISNDGYILTNYHVVETSLLQDMPLIVSLNDGSEYDAIVIGYETNNDVALVKIAATGLNPAIIANSDNINVGQTVYAVGNPLGELVYTMTDGIVSARDREVSLDGKTINTFQFSAAVNSGNSGGPLYDTNGEVIGIVTAKPRTASVEGIGFAIPINDAFEIARELIEFGYITGRPLIGITVQTVTSAHADYWDWVVGVRVMKVVEESAAEKAGLLVGDIITSLEDTEIETWEAMTNSLRRYRAGETATLIVWRDGEYIEMEITFDEDLSAGQAR